MKMLLASIDQNYAWVGLVPVGMLVVGFIINVSSLHSKDMNRKSGIATNLFFIALLVEAAAWMVRAFGGGTETGVFWTVVTSALLHLLSGVVALWAIVEHRVIGRWPHGRRRANWGFWLNLIALALIAAWFYLNTNPKLYKRIVE
jgi:fatty acid desaturase